MSQYFKFTGLAKRQEYWAVIVIAYAISFALGFVLGGLMLTGATGLYLGLIGIVAVTVAAVWVSLATTVRRCRDAGISPWWSVLLIIPYVGFVALIVYGVIKSQELTDD